MSLNKALFEWNGPMGLPRFTEIDPSDFAPAFEEAFQFDRAAVNAIADNPEAATFENTIDALEAPREFNAQMLEKVSAIFWNLMGAHSNDTLRELESDIAPKMSRHMSETAANKKLFKRIDTLWQQKDSLELSHEQIRVLEKHWKNFVRAGAALDDQGQSKLSGINAELAQLGSSFSQNILADEANWSLILEDGDDLAGLPDFLKSAMQAVAEERGHENKFAVTLSRSIIDPFLTFSARRDLREKAFQAWTSRGENKGEHDNRAIVAKTVKLRQDKAELLGYESFAHFKLENQMAKQPDAVTELLEKVWTRAVKKAGEEQSELETLIAETGTNHSVEPWDWRHYSEKLRAHKFDFDEAELKSYLTLDNIITASFDVANRLFGITVEEHKDVDAYHSDVRTFEVKNADGSHRAVFLADYFARSSKRSGAWMSGFKGQHKLNDGETPIIINVMNFAKAPEGEETLLSLDDARTLFHEFGHALHGILSDVTYPSVSGTSVARDFVELPSQLYEHWLTLPDVLSKHARHVETGEPIPQSLLEKVLSASKFNAGFNAVEFTSSALVDMEFHKAHSDPIEDVISFEKEALERLGMPSAITMRHRTPHFAHVFSGDGYSAGYYSYMWSEVLDADAFSAFEETGDTFDKDMAKRLHDHIYSAGSSVDAEETYKAFRGKMPTADAMIEKRGLA